MRIIPACPVLVLGGLCSCARPTLDDHDSETGSSETGSDTGDSGDGDGDGDGEVPCAPADELGPELCLGPGTPRCYRARDLDLGSTTFDLAVADFDRDGHDDLVVAARSIVKVFQSTDGCNLGSPLELPVDGSAVEVEITDFDADGTPGFTALAWQSDTGESRLHVRENVPGQEAWEAVELLAEDSAPMSLSAGRFSGLDGDEVIATFTDSSFHGLTRSGDSVGAWGGPWPDPFRPDASVRETIPVRMEGEKDQLAVYLYDHANGDARVLGVHGFLEDPPCLCEDWSQVLDWAPGGMAMGDVSEFGGAAADAVVGDLDAATLTAFHQGQSGIETETFPTELPVHYAALLDVDDDGWVDAVVSHSVTDAAIGVLPGLPGGGFGPEQLLALELGARHVTSGEFNADGLPDLVILHDDGVQILLSQPLSGG